MAPKKVKQDFYHYKEGKMHFFCPLCHSHQSTNTIRRVGPKHFAQLGVLTLAISIAGWPIFGWNGLYLFFPFWLSFELFYRMRKRQALICQSCGFDPFLYKQDVRRARAALKEHWQKKIDTENLFVGKKLKNYKSPTAQNTTQEVANANNAALNDGKNRASPSNPNASP
jgi:hypothetical protein